MVRWLQIILGAFKCLLEGIDRANVVCVSKFGES
jgi:hypothetical protein